MIYDREFLNYLQRFSVYRRLLKVTAYILRLGNMLRIDRKPHKFLTSDELKFAEILLIKHVQSIYFSDVIEYFVNVFLPLPAIVRQLNLKLVNEVILCEGRLSSCLKIDAKFPILLPSRC